MNQCMKSLGTVFLSTLFLISNAHAEFKLQVNNNSLQTIQVHYNNSKLGTISPGKKWVSNASTGQMSLDIPTYGILSLLDIGTEHITGDELSLSYGVLITYQEMDVVGRYQSRTGGVLISIGKYGEVALSGCNFNNTVMGMTLNDVDINRLTHN